MTSQKTNVELNAAVLAAICRGDRVGARKIADQYWNRVYREVPADYAAIFQAMCAQWVGNKEMK